MCNNCMMLNRRQFLKTARIGVAAVGLALTANLAVAKTALTPDQSLTKLITGNNKYLTAPELCLNRLAETRASIAPAQSPWASILTCSDSRVVPELVFGGQSLGELFVARDAGNTADSTIIGTLEYGVAELGIPLVVVLGHSNCGAVKAACAYVKNATELPGSFGDMLRDIIPVAKSQLGKDGDFIDNVVRENAKQTAAKIGKSPLIAPMVKAGTVKIVAARYDLNTGKVDFLRA